MNYEQKYKEALERARKLYEQGTITESLNYVFPELKESEDEKIRKHLISLVKNWDKDGIFSKYTSNPKEVKQILAWLEKLKVFAEHGDGLYYFINNGFTYVDNPTCDNVSRLEKQGEKDEKIRKLCEVLVRTCFRNKLCTKEEIDKCMAWLKSR